MIKIIFFLAISTFLYGFVDNDFDGVDDAEDRCLNTPFEYVVDRYGCPKDKAYIGKITLEVQHTLQTLEDEQYTIDGIYLDYNYNNYFLSISKYSYDLQIDTTFSVGYILQKDDISAKVYVGLQDSLTKEYFCSFGLDYYKDNFLYFGALEYKNISQDISLLFGFSYFVDDYEFTSSYLSISQDIGFEMLYNLDKKLYVKSGYSVSIDNSHSLYFGIGVSFE